MASTTYCDGLHQSPYCNGDQIRRTKKKGTNHYHEAIGHGVAQSVARTNGHSHHRYQR
jgi:hypothetical protein